jgi:hypothetical protein
MDVLRVIVLSIATDPPESPNARMLAVRSCTLAVLLTGLLAVFGRDARAVVSSAVVA